MQTELQYLLGRLAEECSEVAKEALKAQAFGLDDKYHEDDGTLEEKIVNELNDVEGIVWLLKSRGVVLHNLGWGTLIEEKVRKVKKFMDYARDRGMLE